jgi:hypothetical protein
VPPRRRVASAISRAPESGAGPSPAAPSPLYAETSAVLRVLLEGDAQLATALAAAPVLVTSELTLVEADRGLRRARLDGRLDATGFGNAQQWLVRFARSCNTLALNSGVLDRARRDFPVEPVRTLDGIHLATLKMWDETVGPVSVLSTDNRVRANAAAWGLSLVPPEPGRHPTKAGET